ncbi:hypothetical protein SDC9_196287 [bioreactor metagenome]|uniref:Uncharacterized protein n=1 Tax=bioreactor metagenome TaxID=1076179 RepID=A0A645IBM5_9ZZZZ
MQLLERIGIHPRVHAASAFEIVVMKHDNLLVPRELNIQLHAITRVNRRLKRGERILRHALVSRKQPAVGKRALFKWRTLLLPAPRG